MYNLIAIINKVIIFAKSFKLNCYLIDFKFNLKIRKYSKIKDLTQIFMKKKAKKIDYDCIVVVGGVMSELQELGVKYTGEKFSEQSVYNALKFATNSEAAKEIRKVAMERGGKKITKTKVVFV